MPSTESCTVSTNKWQEADDMIDRTLRDQTQLTILPHLLETENLAARAICKETGADTGVQITAMPDLGLANNAIRMRGGFFTGMYMEWNSNVPFIPVDATVNSCGVSVYVLNQDIPIQEFPERIEEAKQKLASDGYNWNFERGNHFISICRMDDGKYCAVMHASADEYKRDLREFALYPDQKVWYHDRIKTVWNHDHSRYLRYLVGSSAERFIDIALGLEDINHRRMQDFADAIFGSILDTELIHVPHYGMPTASSVAIGCSWKANRSILLSLPGRDFCMIENSSDLQWLTPHGFGASIPNLAISYDHSGFCINGTYVFTDADVRCLDEKNIRLNGAGQDVVDRHIQKILDKCDAVISERFHPLLSINKDVIERFEN